MNKLYQLIRPEFFLVALFSEFMPGVKFVGASQAAGLDYTELPVVIIQTDTGQAVSGRGDSRSACEYAVDFSVIHTTPGLACTLANEIYAMCIDNHALYETFVEGRTWLNYVGEINPPHPVISVPALGGGHLMDQWNVAFQFIIRNKVTK